MNIERINELNAEIKELQDKLSYAYDVRKQAIRTYYKRGYTVSDIGRAFNMPKQNVSKIVNNQ